MVTHLAVGSNPRPAAPVVPAIRLRPAAASITVSSAMLSTAYSMLTLVHGAPIGAAFVSRWPQVEIAQRTNDAASGV
ncbi:MAG: hypothetical protein QOH83_794 [Solirubrobacteraceae bacterium]|jgi:hypothetical protein|nr:hypothetical protein [Solirubrobacteraceae bacterium]